MLFSRSCRLAPSRVYFRYGNYRLQSTSSHPLRYGFVGLGRMGYPMALNLLRKINRQSSFTIYDINPLSLSRFVNESNTLQNVPNVHVAHNPKDLAERSDYIITMLPESEHVSQVFEHTETGFLALTDSASPKLFIDSSTVSPFYSLSLAEKVASATHLSAHLLDAPVSGGTRAAQTATLTFMLGSPKELVPLVTPVLEKMGQRIMWCGPPSSGLSAKLANNYILAAMNIATAEAMNMGLRLGLDPHKLADVINASTGASWCSKVNNPVRGVSPGAPVERDYEGGFGVKLMRKDLKLALSAARSVDAKIALGEDVFKVYEQLANDKELGGKDFSVVYKWLGGDD